MPAAYTTTTTTTTGAIPEPILKPWRLPPQRTYLFTNASIVDPVEGKILSSQYVVTAGGYITYVNSKPPPSTALLSASSSSTTQPPITVDLSGLFLCPGLIDCHVHLSSVPGGATLSETSSSTDPAVSLLRQPFACMQILARGFTTVRDTGGATLALKQAIEDDVFPGPRVIMAGRALSQSGGHGDRRGAHDPQSLGSSSSCCGGGSEAAGLSVVCDGVPECIRAGREQLRTGADFLKIMTGGGVASSTDRLTSVQFTSSEIRAIVEVATNAGTYVTAHAYTPAAIRHAVDNGCRGIEHGNLIDELTAKYMASKGVWLTPTLVTYEAMSSPEYGGFLPPGNKDKNEEVLKKGLESLEICRKADVRMCFGSDLLGPLTREQSGEFGIRGRVLKGAEVVRQATVDAAEMLGIEKEVGQVREGMRADLLVVRGNPMEDVGVLARPREGVMAVMRNGRVEVSRWEGVGREERGEVLV